MKEKRVKDNGQNMLVEKYQLPQLLDQLKSMLQSQKSSYLTYTITDKIKMIKNKIYFILFINYNYTYLQNNYNYNKNITHI